MRKQTIVLAGGAVILFGLGVGASLGVVGNEESPARPPAATTEMEPGVHTMPGGATMTGPMEDMETHEEDMPDMTMTEPMDDEDMGGHTMPGGMTMTGQMEEMEHGDDEMPGMTMTEP